MWRKTGQIAGDSRGRGTALGMILTFTRFFFFSPILVCTETSWDIRLNPEILDRIPQALASLVDHPR